MSLKPSNWQAWREAAGSKFSRSRIHFRDISRLFRTGAVVVKFARAITPLGLAPAVGADGVTALPGAAGNRTT